MSVMNLEKLSTVVAEKIRPFVKELIDRYSGNIHSVHIVGSSLTPDYDEKTSDINSVVVLKTMDLEFVKFIAPLGRKYKKKGIAAPLIMTPEYIAGSLDVFPIEFLDFTLIHQTIFGEDILKGINVNATDLRLQCEREIKSKLIGLRQGYISSLGDRKILTKNFADSLAGYMALFRGIIFLMGKNPPVSKLDVIHSLSNATSVNTDIFIKILDIRKGKIKPNKEDLKTMFEQYYTSTEKIGKCIDEHQI
jgi:predicted nucleotidyltransferase